MSLREQKKRAARVQILVTANSLIEARGYEQTTMRDIAAGAGISYQTLYNYFPTKGDILFQLLVDQIEDMSDHYAAVLRNFDGDLLWGGFEADGTSRHAYIPSSQRSVVYNFDAQPGAPALVPGEIYQWRLWADKGTQLDGKVEQLISASEDLRGLFVVPEPDPIEPPAR